MMIDIAPGKADGSKQTVSRRWMLRTTGTAAGAGIWLALFGTDPAGAQQTLEFGEVAVGSSETRTVSQPNPTEQPLPVTGIEITGPDADQFSVVDGDAPFTLQPDESRTVTIQFAPTSTGEKSASIQVEVVGGTSRTAGQLTGTGVDEAAEQNGDDSSTDDSTASSSPETTADESTSDTAEDATTSGDVAASETPDSVDTAQATEGDSSPEDAAAPGGAPEASPQSNEERPSIILILDFNNNGVIDLEDILLLIRYLG